MEHWNCTYNNSIQAPLDCYLYLSKYGAVLTYLLRYSIYVSPPMAYLQFTTCDSKEKSSWTCGNRVGTAVGGAVIRTHPLTRQNDSLPVQSKCACVCVCVGEGCSHSNEWYCTDQQGHPCLHNYV